MVQVWDLGKGRGKEGLSRKSFRLWQNSEKVLTIMLGSPHAKSAHMRNPPLRQEWPSSSSPTVLGFCLGAALGEVWPLSECSINPKYGSWRPCSITGSLRGGISAGHLHALSSRMPFWGWGWAFAGFSNQNLCEEDSLFLRGDPRDFSWSLWSYLDCIFTKAGLGAASAHHQE